MRNRIIVLGPFIGLSNRFLFRCANSFILKGNIRKVARSRVQHRVCYFVQVANFRCAQHLDDSMQLVAFLRNMR